MKKRLYVNDKVKLLKNIAFDGEEINHTEKSISYKKGEIFKIKDLRDFVYLCTKGKSFNNENEVPVSWSAVELYKRPLLNKIANFFNLGIKI